MFETVNNHTMLNDASYKHGKNVLQIYIPGFSSLYFIIGNILSFPAIELVIGILAIIATVLGVCLSISSSNYRRSEAGYDGSISVETTQSGGKLFSLELGGDPEEIEEKYSVAFKVKSKV